MKLERTATQRVDIRDPAYMDGMFDPDYEAREARIQSLIEEHRPYLEAEREMREKQRRKAARTKELKRRWRELSIK